MSNMRTLIEMLKGVYEKIDSGDVKNYGDNFVADMKKVRGDINNQVSLLKSCGVAYSDSAMMKILENVGVKKYF